jgi:hypothetical protein
VWDLAQSTTRTNNQLNRRIGPMTQANEQPQPRDAGRALQQLVLARASEINGKLLARLATVSDDLDAGRHRAALGGLDGIEQQIETMRSFLLLLQ